MKSTTLSFPAPEMFCARRISGLVVADEESGGRKADHPPPPELHRSSSIAGNILLVEEPNSSPRAYWLHRKFKLSNTSNGCLRVGYKLRTKNESNADTKKDTVWCVQKSSGGPYPYEMVAIKVQDRFSIFNDQKAGDRNPSIELSALQMVKELDPNSEGHVIGTREMCLDEKHIYTIMPYFGGGTLFDYVAECGRLPECVARHFFKQIIRGIETLREAQICHRDLSLQNVLLRGSDCVIVGLGVSLRVPQRDESASPTLLEPKPICNSDFQYLAPEILKNEPYDGYSMDLWAASIMLCVMLFGAKAPFILATPEDKGFQEICVNGNLKQLAKRWEEEDFSENKTSASVSDEALDLIQSMMHADPAERLTLEKIKDHIWFIAQSTPPKRPQMAFEQIAAN